MSPGVLHSPAEIEAKLRELVGEQLQVVTYKWLARHFALPASLAKQLLFAFVEAHRGQAAATYFLSGFTKPGVGDDSNDSSGGGAEDGKDSKPGGRRRIAQLVDAARLEARRAELDQVTSLHVYSVQPAQPKDTAELWNTDHLQMEQLFAELLKTAPSGSGSNALRTDSGCVAGAALSSVACEAAVRDPKRVARPVAASAAAPTAATKAAPSKPKPADVLAAVKAGKVSADSGAKDGEAGESKQAVDKATQRPATANGAARLSAGGKVVTGSRKPASGGALAGMWSRAPPQKRAAAPKSAPAATMPAGGDAEAALRAAREEEEEEASSSSSDGDVAIVPRRRPGRGKRITLDLEDDDDGGPEEHQEAAVAADEIAATKPPPSKARRKTVSDSANSSQLQEGAEDADVNAIADTKAANGKAPAAKRSRKTAVPAKDEDAAEVASKAKTKRTAAKAAPKPGHVKLGAELGGGKRRKVMRTTYDSSGEEVNEMVWEDELVARTPDPADGPASAAGGEPMDTCDDGRAAAAAEPVAREAEADEKAAKPAAKRAASPAKAASSAKGSAGSARGASPGATRKKSGGGTGSGKGSGGAKASGGAAAAAKKSGKAKAGQPNNQRNIMSFFAKK